jgi:hypothetical protein
MAEDGLPSVRNADDGIHILQRAFQELIRENTRSVLEPENTMIGKHGTNTKEMCVQYTLVSKR